MQGQYTRRTAIQRFWAKVVQAGPVPDHRPELGPCWTWAAFIDKAGYGRFRTNGKNVGYAHIFSYTTFIGPIDDGLEIDHLCRNRACPRPDHLEAVTHQINTLRGNGWMAVRVRGRKV